ncbi:MFS transporter [Halobacillus andaensis]|uniref:MFS transporter n=1 Tax=Halobacillus andaensis TaxID=1176239 RepID=UPI003D73653A
MGAIRKEEGVGSTSGVTVAGAKIGFIEKIGYGLGDLASNLIFAAISMFLTFYYTDVVGVSAAIVGTIILVSKIFDGFTDIVMGVAIDKTTSKHGKARPWLLWMAVPYTISGILLYTVPNFGSIGTLIYIAVTYNLIHFVYTAINIPYGVMNARMTQDRNQRSVLNIFRSFMALAGALILMNFTIPLVEKIWWWSNRLDFNIYPIWNSCRCSFPYHLLYHKRTNCNR